MIKYNYINSIRHEYSGLKDMPRESLASSVRILADDIYAKDSHFIFELIQNAEDNNYPNQSDPQLRFKVCLIDIDGQYQTTLIVQNNEIGFNDKNVRAICQVGQSTKKKLLGYIGEKGIGFKSVFRITSNPYIFSNGFQFCLPEKDDQTGLGYIVPRWVLHPPHGISEEETSIILPLNKNKKDIDDVIKALREISPETILFLKKLKTLEVSINLTDSSSLYNLTIEKKVIKTIGDSELIELICKSGDDQNGFVVDTCNYWVTELEFDKPTYAEHEKRTGIESRFVSVAIPLNDKPSKGKLFAYLPVWEETGVPFLINADFLLVSSRESIHEGEDWNKWLRDCVIKTYTSSFLALLNTPKINFKMKVFGYASIPIKTHHPFLQPVIDEITKILSDSHCVLTLPDKSIAKPSATKLCNQNFRELLADNKNLPAHLIKTVQLACPEMEKYSGGLKAIGIKSFTLPDILFCLEDTIWLKEHELKWFLKLFRYLKTQKLTSDDLQERKILPVKGKEIFNLSCTVEQPIYLSLNQADKIAHKDVPSWLSNLVPIAELDQDFEELLTTQKDHEDLKEWMQQSLGLYAFSKENFCVDIIYKLEEKYLQLDIENLVEAAQWLSDNVAENFGWDNLPIVLADGQKMLLVEAYKHNLVVPEMFDQENGWQNIWPQAQDRTHFVVLNEVYLVIQKKWFESIDIKYFPPFADIEYAWYSLNDLYAISYLISEAQLLDKCRVRAASSRRGDTNISSYSLPSSLRDLPKEEHSIKLLSCSLLSYLKKINITDSSISSWAMNETFYQLGFFAKGIYHNRGIGTDYSSSCVLRQLRQLKWFPTTKGYVRPSQAFLPKDGVKEILGDTVPYFEGNIPEYISSLLEVRSEVKVTDLIELLRDHSDSDKPNHEMIVRVYDELFIRTERINHNIKVTFSNEFLIYINNENEGKKWFTSGECVWEDATDILGNEFACIQEKYPKMYEFFVNRLGVKERIDTECYAKSWLKLQKTPLINFKKQRELVQRLYREIKPVALMPEEEKPEWWGNYFFDQAKIYSQTDTFCDTSEIFLPDDKFIQTMFNEDVEFAWLPENSSFSDWKSFFCTFNIPLLSESVTEQLVEDVVPNIFNINHYVTESAIKMIACWLREKRPSEYEALFRKDIFKHLLLLKESLVITDIEIEFCLQTDNYIYGYQNEFYPAFWDRRTYILYYNTEVSKSKVAQVLSKYLTTNYNDLAVWIEVVLGSESIERIKEFNWNIPREINDLFSEQKPSSKTNKELLEDVTITQTIESFDCTETDPKSPEPKMILSSAAENELDTKHVRDTPATPPHSSTPDSSINNKLYEPLLSISNEDVFLINEKDSAPMAFDSPTFNYIDSLKAAFTQNGLTQFNEEVTNRANNDYSESLSNPNRRAEKLAERYLENIKNEPSFESRHKNTDSSLLESPNESVRASLFEWYQGKCQICHETWPKRDGIPYFTAAYIVERQNKRWLDEPGNAICLCAKHFAQWRLATKHATTEITEQISNLKLDSEGGIGTLSIHFHLVGQEAVINLCERHAIALRKLLVVASVNLEQDAIVEINPISAEIHSTTSIIIDTPASIELTKKNRCPYCQAEVSDHRYQRHIKSKCPKRHSNNQERRTL